MRIYKQDELKSKIKSGSFAPVYFLFGNEPYLITHYTNLIIKNNVTALEDINLRYYDSEFDADEIYATAFQVPMMSARKCLVITDCDFSKLSEKQLSVFCDLAENPSDVSIVVFRYTVSTIQTISKLLLSVCRHSMQHCGAMSAYRPTVTIKITACLLE